jgi:SRSO17 transposase
MESTSWASSSALLDRFRCHIRTRTQDTSEYGLSYVSGLLRMEAKRTMANIGRKTNVSIQSMQHFVSNSPWSGRTLVEAVQDEVKGPPAFQAKAMLILDESADEKADDHNYTASSGLRKPPAYAGLSVAYD